MRRLVPTTLSILAVATAFGCAQSNPAAKLAVTAVAPEAAAPKDALKAAAATVTVRAAEPTTEAAELAQEQAEAATAAVTVAAGAPAPVAEAEVAEAPLVDLASLAAQLPRRSAATADAGAQNILDPWRPYGVGVMSKTATSVTLAWRTDLDSKAIIYFGKSFGLTSRGYDGVYHDTDSRKVHQVTITGLSRFRSYTFSVIGLGALGMQFPTYPFKTRTHLF